MSGLGLGVLWADQGGHRLRVILRVRLSFPLS